MVPHPTLKASSCDCLLHYDGCHVCRVVLAWRTPTLWVSGQLLGRSQHDVVRCRDEEGLVGSGTLVFVKTAISAGFYCPPSNASLILPAILPCSTHIHPHCWPSFGQFRSLPPSCAGSRWHIMPHGTKFSTVRVPKDSVCTAILEYEILELLKVCSRVRVAVFFFGGVYC